MIASRQEYPGSIENVYEPIREISRGGMATVFLARQLALDRLVAVKILHRNLSDDEQFLKRFAREARIISRLSHANIVQIYDSCIVSEKAYIVTEYVSGGDLGKMFQLPLDAWRKKTLLMARVAAALEYVHDKGVVHRDIKPSNILLTPEGEPKICDFGIATALWGHETRLTRTFETMGTLDYIAPEQKENAHGVDFRADIYSFGVILYQLLTGIKPEGAFRTPSQLVSFIPRRLDEAVMTCLQARPQNRFASTAVLRRELESYAVGFANSPEGSGYDFDYYIEKFKSASLSERIHLKTAFLNNLDPVYIDPIMRRLDQAEGMIKEILIEALGKLKAEAACEKLIKLLRAPLYLRVSADALAEIGCKEAEPELLRILKAGNDHAPSVLLPLGRLKSRRALRTIAAYLKKGNPRWLRERALEALAAFGGRQALDFLRRSAENDPDPELRARAKKLLGGA